MHITVYGTPAPQGSKRHVGNGVMVESSMKVKPWREAVKWAARDAVLTGRQHVFAGDMALHVSIEFRLPRPQSHYGTGRNATTLRASAPAFPYRKPDLDKLTRSTLDALSDAGVWTDDSRVVALTVEKVYADEDSPGAGIWIEEMER